MQLFANIPSTSVDLVFADPPFNIGYEYDVYQDRREASDYENWCEQWIKEIHRVLKPHGSFWLAIGDEYAAELKMVAQRKAGFYCRSWVIWYYTFGVNCVRAFTRSHTHLLHFVRDPEHFTFNSDNPAVRIPSARQLVYADARSNPKGRLPDNTWIYRPQDAHAGSFSPRHDVWYYSRVAGTFKEREGFHGCQMPEQLLGRIIRISSNVNDLVLDPFAGSGTTLATAKKLARQYLGFELSQSYAAQIEQRLARTQVGDPLDGPADPVSSAPNTKNGRANGKLVKGRVIPHIDTKTEKAIVQAFNSACSGHSVDQMLCDPDLNEKFIRACKQQGLEGHPFTWNKRLLGIRKSSKLKNAATRKPKRSFQEMDGFSFAAEIAWHLMEVDYGLSLDEILCDPEYAAEFDRLAAAIAPGHKPRDYRWAAMSLRKRAKSSKKLAAGPCKHWLRGREPQKVALENADFSALQSGAYVIYDQEGNPVYVGEALHVGNRIQLITQKLGEAHASSAWHMLGAASFSYIAVNGQKPHGVQSALVTRWLPPLNVSELRAERPKQKAQPFPAKRRSTRR